MYYLQALSDKCFMSHDASIFMNIHELEITDSDVQVNLCVTTKKRLFPKNIKMSIWRRCVCGCVNSFTVLFFRRGFFKGCQLSPLVMSDNLFFKYQHDISMLVVKIIDNLNDNR